MNRRKRREKSQFKAENPDKGPNRTTGDQENRSNFRNAKELCSNPQVSNGFGNNGRKQWRSIAEVVSGEFYNPLYRSRQVSLMQLKRGRRRERTDSIVLLSRFCVEVIFPAWVFWICVVSFDK